MSDRPQASPQAGNEVSPRHLVRNGHVMRSIVRNMVVNMETVLNDLQGIMGDIQSLVVQIDSVTDKIDKQCGAEGSASSQESQHCVKKPQCIRSSQQYSSAVYNPLYGQRGQDAFPIQHLPGASGMKKIEPIRPFRRDHRPGSSKQPFRSRPHSSEIRSSFDKSWFKDSKIPISSKSFSHFPAGGEGVMSPGGSVAIVHPTIFHKPAMKPSNSSRDQHGSKMGEETDSVLYEVPCAEPCKAKECVKKISTPQQCFVASEMSQRPSIRSKQLFPRHKHGIKAVYNKHFQPVTPTEQPSPIIPHASHVVKQVPIKNSLAPQSTAGYSSTASSPHHKYATIGGSLPNSPRMRRSATGLTQESSPNSPRLNRTSVKPYYHQIEGSVSSNMSPVSIRKPGAHHYYYSIESDLDSISEGPDARSMTPDIDFSYLNLIGNRNPLSVIAGKQAPPGSDEAYEIPVIPTRISQPFQMLQNSPDVVSHLPIFQPEATTFAESYHGRCTSSALNELAFMNKIYNSPLVTHVYCSEVSAFDLGEYCGCYEAIVDSVLENIAGFENFDDACAHLDNDEVVIESYVSFDDEFEEDEWDLGMRAEDQEDFDLRSFIIHDTDESDQSLFGSFEIPDDNQNIFDEPSSVHENALYLENKCRRPVALQEQRQQGVNMSDGKEIKKKLSSSNEDKDGAQDDAGVHELRGRNSFTDDDCCALKPSLSGEHQNFSLWPKSFTSDDAAQQVARETVQADLDAQTSSSDASSCQAVGSGSPMSFSSPEAAFTSPDTDRFVTSSEGDDLLTSQEEAYFQSGAHDNAYVSNHRTNMSQLRREFFESLYSVCDKHEKEKALDQVTDASTQELTAVDNSKDNLSEAGSYHEEMTSYNRNVNTWTAFAMVHVQGDDVSDSASDIINDNNISTHSMTSSYIDADNIAAAPGSQSLSY